MPCRHPPPFYPPMSAERLGRDRETGETERLSRHCYQGNGETSRVIILWTLLQQRPDSALLTAIVIVWKTCGCRHRGQQHCVVTHRPRHADDPKVKTTSHAPESYISTPSSSPQLALLSLSTLPASSLPAHSSYQLSKPSAKL